MQNRQTSYDENSLELMTSAETQNAFTPENAESYNAWLSKYLNAVAAGDLDAATAELSLLLLAQKKSRQISFAVLKNYTLTLNHFCALRLLATSVHPFYVFRQMTDCDHMLEGARSFDQFRRLSYEFTHKYCLLARNYSLSEYSYLIRNVVNYINQNLDEELTLSGIAARYKKNASYLSAQFNKEVGCPLTEYIHRTRVTAALRYLNTTEMSISDIATAVGFTDLSYFSRVFKKQVGKSPSEYRKMVKNPKA